MKGKRNKPRPGIGANDWRVPSGLMGKTEFAAKFEASVRLPPLEAFFGSLERALLSDRALSFASRWGSRRPLRWLPELLELAGSVVDRRALSSPELFKLALFGRRGRARHRSALGGLLRFLLGKHVRDWAARQVAGRRVPAHRRKVRPPPKTYRGWKRLRDATFPGWKLVPDPGEPVRILPTDRMDPKERVERLVAGKETDRVGFGPNWNFAQAYLGGSNLWEFCYDGIAAGLAAVNAHLRLGGTDFLPTAFGLGAYAVPFPDAHSRFFFDFSLPHDAGFPQFLESEILPSLDALFDHGLVAQAREVTKRLTRDAVVMMREALYFQCVLGRYFGPVRDRYYDYAAGILSSFDLLPLARGVVGFARDCRKRPDDVRRAFWLLTKPMVDLWVRLCHLTGAKTVLVGCSRGSNTFMSVETFERTHWPPMKYALETFIANGITPTCHFDNDWTENVEFLAEKLPKRSVLLHLDQVDLVDVHDRVGDHFCLMGGLSPGVVALGSPAKLEAELRRQVEAIGEDGLILASGCEFPVDVPVENVYAYKKVVSEVGVFRR
ncbi:MAG: hypothetical protein Kow0069_26320 [Promethearchaeota archaeon]